MQELYELQNFVGEEPIDSWYRLRNVREIELDFSLRKLREEYPGYEAVYFLRICSVAFSTLAEQGFPTIMTLAQLCIPLRMTMKF